MGRLSGSHTQYLLSHFCPFSMTFAQPASTRKSSAVYSLHSTVVPAAQCTVVPAARSVTLTLTALTKRGAAQFSLIIFHSDSDAVHDLGLDAAQSVTLALTGIEKGAAPGVE